MAWAKFHIERLSMGQTVQFRPRGHSMKGKIKSGQLVTVRPVSPDHPLMLGDIVLCRVKGKDFLHLISARDGDRCQISNNRGFVNGWIHRSKVFGLCTKIED